MGSKHSREHILAAALDVAATEGLASLAFGRVAQELGIPDRTVVYYFPTKVALLHAVLEAVTGQVQAALAPALAGLDGGHVELADRAWQVMRRSSSGPAGRLFLEALGLAASGREPFATVVPAVTDGWVEWTAGHLSGTRSQRRSQALAALALVDALLLLHHTAGEGAARAAARVLLRPGD